MKNYLLLLLASFFILISCGGNNSGGSTTVLKLSHNHANGYPVDIAYKKFAEIVEKNSGNKFKIQIYPSSQLGDQKASLELAKSGVIQFAHINTSVLENFDSVYSVLNLPYMFKDYEHYTKVMRSDKMTEIFESTLDKGFISLIYIEGGSRSIYTKSKVINTPNDLKGIKLRVQDSPTYIEMAKLLGATPVTLNFSEVYTSLQQGVIDAAENNFPSYVEAGHAEVAKEYSMTEMARTTDILSVGAPFWNSLSEEDKEIFRNAAKETELLFANLWKESEEKNIKRAVDEFNVNITHPDIEPFRKLIIPMHHDFAKKDTRIKDLIDYIKSVENE